MFVNSIMIIKIKIYLFSLEAQARQQLWVDTVDFSLGDK